jgi:hypothetical protein
VLHVLWLHRYGRVVAYYNMLAWWRQRTEHEQVEWCNVVRDHAAITAEMAEVVGSYRFGSTPGGAWLIAIRDSSAPVTPSEQTWIMSRRFEAFIREQCR